MPCDGKNPNCDRRRELLAQLKCLVSSMDRKKPCEWDEPDCPPPTCCPVCPTDCPPCCSPVKACKSFELRGSLMYRCECIKRNGLQDRCMMFDCMGRPECMTKLYPVCGPGRSALLKLTDLGDAEVALKKYYCADQARESALAAYCRLTCGSACSGSPGCAQNGPSGCCPQEEDDPCCPQMRSQPQCCPAPPSPCCPPPQCCPPPPCCPPPQCCPPPPQCCPPPPCCPPPSPPPPPLCCAPPPCCPSPPPCCIPKPCCPVLVNCYPPPPCMPPPCCPSPIRTVVCPC